MRRSMLSTLCALLFLALPAAGAFASSGPPVVQLSTDPYTNSGAQHQTEGFATSASNGAQVVTAFGVGQYPGNPATGQGPVGFTNVGWALNVQGEWVQHGFLQGTTTQVGGPCFSVDEPNVAWDAKAGSWILVMDCVVFPDQNGFDVNEIAYLSTTGTAWTGPITVNVQPPNFLNDAPKVGCDNTESSPFYGNCYDSFTQGNPVTFTGGIVISTSSDAGAHWSAPVASNVPAFDGTPLIQSDGIVDELASHVFPTPQGEVADSEWALVYSPASRTFTYAAQACAACTVNSGFINQVDSNFLPGYVGAAQARGTRYAVWSMCNAACTTNVLFASSSTDGEHWRTPTQIPAAGIDVGLPSLAAATVHGQTVLGLSYDDAGVSTGGKAPQPAIAVLFSSSPDGGVTWAKPETLGVAPAAWFSQMATEPDPGLSATIIVVGGPVVVFPLPAAAPSAKGTLYQNEYAALPE